MVSKEGVQRRTLMQSEIVDSQPAASPEAAADEALPLRKSLEPIIERGKLRVGYNAEELPFSFLNDRGHLVGFDVELIQILAKEIGVDAEFVPYTHENAIAMLDQNKIDLAIGGLIVTPTRLTYVNFSNPYMEMTAAVVVEDYRRKQFQSWRGIDQRGDMRLGVVGKTIAKDVSSYLPNTQIVLMQSTAEFFRGNPDKLDAIVTTAEAGSAWTIIYPSYSVVVPEPFLKTHAAFGCDRRTRILRTLSMTGCRWKRPAGSLIGSTTSGFWASRWSKNRGAGQSGATCWVGGNRRSAEVLMRSATPNRFS
jgi:ABC-type amino acid transport substrate-binding protein